MEKESDPSISTPAGNAPAGGTPEPEKFTMYRELTAIIIVFLIILAAIGYDFVEKSRKKTDKLDQQLMGQLRTAEHLTGSHFLINPRGGAALDVFQAARKQFPDAPEVQEGMRRFGNKFIEMITALLEDRELRLAEETLDYAEMVRPDVQDRVYEAKLVALRLELERLQAMRAATYSEVPELEPLAVFRDPLKIGGTGPALVFLPGGSFEMGSLPDEFGRGDDESPVIEISIKPFALGQKEVSFDEYRIFVEATGIDMPGDNGWGRGNRPVINVSWNDAREYAIWLTRQTGFTYRLPTESEWEFAARAGGSAAFGPRACLDSASANIDDRDPEVWPACASARKYVGKTVPVGSYEASPWGLYDMFGNVREWVQDCWYMNYGELPLDGRGFFRAEGGNCGLRELRVLRGGAWDANLQQSRVAGRYQLDESDYNASAGFRVVREVY